MDNLQDDTTFKAPADHSSEMIKKKKKQKKQNKDDNIEPSRSEIDEDNSYEQNTSVPSDKDDNQNVEDINENEKDNLNSEINSIDNQEQVEENIPLSVTSDESNSPQNGETTSNETTCKKSSSLSEEIIPTDKITDETKDNANDNESAPHKLGGETNEQNSDNDDDDGDPIPSGTGVVSRDCSASDLIGWSEILPKWHSKLNQRPKGLTVLVRNGIPEPLRGEVWQLLSGAQQYTELMEHYRIFLTKSAPAEQMILRDVHRTYPAHENFRSGAGTSSLLDSLFKVCKAYAVYDEEVGYCQGLSFLVAALLLHMPEEQAFCVFVCIMQHYGLRDLFRNNFDELYLKFYQLERLLEDHMPDLYRHFSQIGIEPFTYASQWFLTVFTAKFPLNAVFYIMDIFLLDGMNTIFQIALALLSGSKQDLLALDFEGVLKYFRVQMPKRYRNQENVQLLISASSEISLKRLKKYAKSYESMKQKERLMENPVTRLQRENAKLTENNIRLEQENDDLARDLVASKIQLRAQLDVLEDKTETLNKALTYSHQDNQTYLNTISDMEDERSRLEVEVTQLKEVCRRELQRAEMEQVRDSSIIADYKKICSQLSKQIDYRVNMTQNFIESMKDELRDNELCTGRKCLELFSVKANELVESLKSDNLLEQQQQQTSSSSTPSQGNSPKSKQSSPKQQEIRAASVESDISNRPIGAYLKTAVEHQSTSSEHKIQHLTKHVDELEVELARTKLALVEAECRCQQLTHDMSVGASVATTTTATTPNNKYQTTGLLSNKLISMKAAITSTRSTPKSSTTSGGRGGGGGAFAKINNIISEKISNISQVGGGYPTPPTPSMSNSKSSPMIANIIKSSGGGGHAPNNNNIETSLPTMSHEVDNNRNLQC